MSLPAVGDYFLGIKFASDLIQYSPGQLSADLAAGVNNIIAATGSDYKVELAPSYMTLAHELLNYDYSGGAQGYSGTLRSGIALSAGGIYMGYNRKSDGNWVTSIAIDGTTGNASFTGAINATSGNFTGTVTAGSIITGSVTVNGVSLADISAAAFTGGGTYDITDLETDLAAGVNNIIAATTSSYNLEIGSNYISIAGDGCSYNTTIGAYTGDLKSGIAMSAGGIYMGYNRKSDGNWVTSIAIDGTTGNASFTGAINATSGNFTGTVTAGSIITGSVTVNGVTLEAISDAAFTGGVTYTTADLQSDLAAGVNNITAATTSSYRVDIGSNYIIIAGDGCAYNTTITPYAGDLKSGIAMSAGGIFMGYNRKDTGAWVTSMALDATTGNASFTGNINATSGNFTGTVEAGSILLNGVEINTSGGTTVGALLGLVNDMGSDNKLSPVEKSTLRTEWVTIVAEKARLNTQSTLFGVTTENTTYNAKFQAYADYLNNGTTWSSGIPDWISDANLAVATTVVSTTFRTMVQEYYDAKIALVNAHVDKARTLANTAQGTANTGVSNAAAAQTTADTAVTNAATAQTAADTANVAVADMASDGKFTPIEKAIYRNAWNEIAAEKAGLNSQAATFAIATENTTYNNAFQALATYLNNGTTWVSGVPSWIADANLSVTTTIVGTTFRANFETYSTARTALFNAFSAKARTLANTAQGTANTGVSNASTAQGRADDAYSLAASAIQPAAIAGMLTSSSSYALSGVVNVTSTGGGFKTGTISWNGSGVVNAGTYGVAITQKGIVAAHATKGTTMSIGTDGSAVFAGDIVTQGDVRCSGKGATNITLSIAGTATYADYSVYGEATSNATDGTWYSRVGVLGIADASVSAVNIGVVGYAQNTTKGYGVYAQGGKAGIFATTANTGATTGAVNASNTGGGNSIYATGNVVVVGSINASGNVTAYGTSDLRWKESIKELQSPLYKLQKVRGVSFDWTPEYLAANGGEDDYFLRKHSVGVIAQEVLEVLPEAVAKREDGTLAVNYVSLIPLLIEAIKELDRRTQ